MSGQKLGVKLKSKMGVQNGNRRNNQSSLDYSTAQ